MLISLTPEGAIWNAKAGGDFDNLLAGMGTNTDTIKDFLDSLSDIRSPQRTIALSDLEKEFGEVSDPSLTDEERRGRLAASKTSSNGDGTDTFLETKLQEAGFDVFVYSNDPPVDPDGLLSSGFKVFCASDEAFCGHEDALCGKGSGQIVANNIPFIDSTFAIPGGSDTWSSVFFVGGVATRDQITNELLTIEHAEIPILRSAEILRLIVKYKPFHTWSGVLIQFV